MEQAKKVNEKSGNNLKKYNPLGNLETLLINQFIIHTDKRNKNFLEDLKREEDETNKTLNVNKFLIKLSNENRENINSILK